MDVSHLKRSHWIVVGGAAVTLIAVLFFSWYSYSIGPFSASASAWDTGTVGKLAVIGALLLAGVAVAIVLNAQANIPVGLPMAALVLALFVALMVILKFIDISSHTAFGMWLTLIAALVTAYGAYGLGGHTQIAQQVNAAQAKRTETGAPAGATAGDANAPVSDASESADIAPESPSSGDLEGDGERSSS